MRSTALPLAWLLSFLGCAALAACSDDDASTSPATTPDASVDSAADSAVPDGAAADADAAISEDADGAVFTDADAQECTPTGIASDFADKLQKVLTDEATKAGMPGATAAVHLPCEGTWAGAAGMFDLSASTPMASGSLLRIASVTKTYTAALIHLLAEEARLSLDDTLETHVAGIPSGNAITIRMLLNHSSGLFDYVDDTAYQTAAKDTSHAFAPAELVGYGTANTPYFEPGKGWHYSNTNYVLLGMIVEKLGGATIGSQIHARLLAPLALEKTFFAGEDTIPQGQLAKGYDQQPDAGPFDDVTDALHPSASWAAGAMVSDAADMARWGHALFDGSVLSKASIDALQDCIETGETGQTWGAGVACLSTPLGTLYGHGGGIPGYSSVVLHSPTKKSTVAVIANMTNAQLDGIVQGMVVLLATH